MHQCCSGFRAVLLWLHSWLIWFGCAKKFSGHISDEVLTIHAQMAQCEFSKFSSCLGCAPFLQLALASDIFFLSFLMLEAIICAQPNTPRLWQFLENFPPNWCSDLPCESFKKASVSLVPAISLGGNHPLVLVWNSVLLRRKPVAAGSKNIFLFPVLSFLTKSVTCDKSQNKFSDGFKKR